MNEHPYETPPEVKIPLLAKIAIGVTMLSVVASIAASGYASMRDRAALEAQHKQNFATWSKEAAQGDAGAQFNLGVMYLNGDNVDYDPSKAYEYFQQAADQGLATAQYAAGNLLLTGQGVQQDVEGALRLMKASAKQGDHQAELALGNIYHYSGIVEHDFAKAANYYEKAAWGNLASAQVNLGAMYHLGRGIEQSDDMAFTWWMVSAANGNEQARRNIKKEFGHLSLAEKEKKSATAQQYWDKLNGFDEEEEKI